MKEGDAFYAAAERRIEYFTAGIGLVAAIAVAIHWGFKPGLGLAAGAVLSWINYRWMKQGVNALAKLSTVQAGAAKARVPASIYFKFIGRYALLIVSAYVILRGFSLPAASVLSGFFVVVAAVIVELVGQLFRGGPLPRVQS
jgi:hypothetical protein